MTFQWPHLLWLLIAIPLLIGLYVLILRRKKKLAVQYASLAIVREAMSARQHWRRHLPPALFLTALALLVVGMARPSAVITLPAQHETIILTMDVSGSMRAADVQPNRITAAQEAAKAFLKDLPGSTRVGIVSFAGAAAIVQPPTENREDLVAAIDRFQLQRGTAIGSGLILSLATLFPDAGIDIAALTYGRSDDRYGSGSPLGNSKPKAEFKPVPAGSYTSAAVILLTDGRATTGPDPLEAAKMLADRGVRVFTVGIGTAEGDTIGFEGWSMRVRLDEATLKQIATLTQGEYFYAGTAADLKKIYEKLNTRLVFETRQTEVSALFAAGAALLLTIAGALSMLWFNRIL